MSQDQAPNGDVDFVDEHAVQDDFKGIVKKVEPQRERHELGGFAVNVLPGGHPPGFVEDVVAHFEARYDPERFDHNEPVGVVFVDRDDPSIVFPVGLWDTVAICRPDDDEYKQGGVAAIPRSADTIRLRGVGAIDVDPAYVVEVTERYDGADE